ncbi:hypothetical protein V8F33_011833 [Rhypophila sp. PSN 637]
MPHSSRSSGSDKSSTDGDSVLPGLSQASIRNEVESMANIIRKERVTSSTTIAIAREASLVDLKRACNPPKKRPSVFRGSTPMPQIYLTTADSLQAAIDNLTLTDKVKTLNLIASPELLQLSFHVPSHFRELKVLRCASPGNQGVLLIDGSSTYHNVRLDEWQAHRHKRHRLVIGHERGVRISLGGQLATLHPHWSRARNEYTEVEKAQLRQQFERLPEKGPWDWNRVKGPVSVIMGIIMGAAKFTAGIAAKGAAGGMYVKYSFGLHAFELGVAGMKASVIATAAGSAVVVGVATMAAIYFIPWDSLFDYMKSAMSWLWDKICCIWSRFVGFVRSLWSSQDQSEKSTTAHGPSNPNVNYWG